MIGDGVTAADKALMKSRSLEGTDQRLGKENRLVAMNDGKTASVTTNKRKRGEEMELGDTELMKKHSRSQPQPSDSAPISSSAHLSQRRSRAVTAAAALTSPQPPTRAGGGRDQGSKYSSDSPQMASPFQARLSSALCSLSHLGSYVYKSLAGDT
jgi:hypothetical protein